MFRAGDVIGPYTLVGELGSGSFGVVWLAVWKTRFWERQVALKLPLASHPDEQMFHKEVQAWLNAGAHPNIVSVLNADEYNGQIAIASEYVSGGSLEQWLQNQPGGKAPSVEIAVELTVGMLSGLMHLHSLPTPLIHCDIKPANILLEGNRPRLTDFGVSRALQNATASQLGGSPAYMAPEMLDFHYSEQSDLWAVGVTLYKMLTGGFPFGEPGMNAAQVGRCIERNPPRSLPDNVPAPIQTIIYRALEKDPAKRFLSAREMQHALTTFDGTQPSPPLKPQPAPLPVCPVTNPPAGVPAYMWLVALAVLGGGGYFAYQANAGSHSGSSGAPNSGNPKQDAPQQPSGGTGGSSAKADLSPPANPTELQPSRTNPVDGAEMVWIPAGEFIRGSNDYKEDEKPQKRITLDGYWIYKNVVTVAQFRKFCNAAGRQMPQEPSFNKGWTKEDHPIVNVIWDDAKAYCNWAGMSLPTEAQWEKAARGTDGRKFPWGNTFDNNKLWCSKSSYGDAGGTTSVGRYTDSPYGLSDMAGNVWQWCADWYDKDYYKTALYHNPSGPTSGTFRVLRGGSWHDIYVDNFRASYRGSYAPANRYDGGGFRCASGL